LEKKFSAQRIKSPLIEKTMSAVNETLIRDVVAEVLGKLGGSDRRPANWAAPDRHHRLPLRRARAEIGSCGCSVKKTPPPTALRGKFGVFATAEEACAAAQEAFLQLKQKGIAARRKIEEIVKALAEKNAEQWGKIEFDETKIGRLDHKIAKLGKSSSSCPAWTGSARRPQRRPRHHAGRIHAVRRRRRGHAQHAFDSHVERQHRQHLRGREIPSCSTRIRARPCAAVAVRAYNEAIYRETGIENIACIIEKPTLDSFNALCKNEFTRLLLVTGGPMVVKAAMQTGKRAICAGPGNPPVFVDDTCCPTRAAKAIISGAAFDNNLLCIGEKQVFVLERSRTS
jgi:aldehyde dehydrogenase